MENGQRMVQRQQHGGRKLVVQRLEAVKDFWFIAVLALLVGALFLVPIGATQAQTLSTEDNARLLAAICPSNASSMGVFTNQINERSVICRDASGAEIGRVPYARFLANANQLGIAVTNESLAITDPGNILSNTLGYTLNQILIWVGGTLVGLISMLLTFAGTLFDLLITTAIINFGGTVQALGMDQAVGLVWSVSRDVANIVIIGMFVFVAIATILGLQNYGWRKYIARILIVAIFINFSLFLTQLVIDGSNVIAYKIYEATPLLSEAHNPENQENSTSLSVGGEATATASGIAATFMDKIGLSGTWDYKNLENIGVANGSLAVLGYALGASLLMGMVAAVLFYGVFLIVTRAILLIFLLLTSALAVGTALLPENLRKKGWNLWLSSLINVAVFAPLIMIFLFLVLAVLNAGVEGSLSDYLKDPASVTDSGDAWQVIVTFIIAIGLLFVSFRLAGTFAKKIGGFNYAAAIPAAGGVIAARVAGWTGRNTIGRGAARFAEAAQSRAKTLAAQDRNVAAGVTRIIGQGVGGLSKQSFNVLNTSAGKGFAGIAGGEKGPIGGLIKSTAKAGKGGFEAQDKETIKKQQEVAEYLAPTDEQKQKVRDEALKNATPEQRAHINQVSEDEQRARVARADAEKRQKDETKRAERELGDAQRPSEQTLTRMRNQIRAEAIAAADPASQQQHRDLLEREQQAGAAIAATKRTQEREAKALSDEIKGLEERALTDAGAQLNLSRKREQQRAQKNTHAAALTSLNDQMTQAVAEREQLEEAIIPASGIEQRIEAAREALVAQKAQQVREVKEENERAVAEAKKRAEDAEKATRAAQKTVIPEGALQSGEEFAAAVAHRRLSNLPWRVLTGQSVENDKVAKKARKGAKDKAEKKKRADIAEAYFEKQEKPEKKDEEKGGETKEGGAEKKPE